jgi:hypothetical protein
LYEKLGEKQKLTAEEQEEWDKVVARFDLVCSEAYKIMYHYLLTAKRVGCKMQLTNWLLI